MTARKTATPTRSTPRRRAARRYHHGDLPRALIDAAVALIARDGIAALTLRAVARRTGVSHAAPVHHFGDLDGLHRAIAAEGFERMEAFQRAAADRARDEGALARLRAIGVAYVEFAAREPAYFRAMFHPRVADRSADPRLEATSTAAFHLLLDSIAAAQREGSVSDGDPRELALLAWSMVHGLASLLADGQLDDTGFASERATELATIITGHAFRGLHP